MPNKISSVDYWAEDNSLKIEMNKKLGLISEHMNKIEKSEAILVVNITKGDMENYIGANTFLEIGYAYHRDKKIYFLNSIPAQKYIEDEILTVEPIIIFGDLTKIL